MGIGKMEVSEIESWGYDWHIGERFVYVKAFMVLQIVS